MDISRQSTIKLSAVVVITFILSRIIFFRIGVCFDATSLNSFWQYIDPVLLKSNLFQSLYYLHSQPPLFNLFLGSILKLSSGGFVLIFNIIYLIFGLMLSLSIFFIMIRLGISESLSAVITILFMISPSAALYENWLFYTYPVTALLCLSVVFLHRFLVNGRLRDGVIFFTLLSIIALTRSLFHIGWFLVFFLILLFYKRHNWKKIVLAACIPFMLIFFVYAKNLYLFGDFASSTSLGMSLAKMTTFSLSENERRMLVTESKISRLALIEPSSEISAYKDYLPEIKKTGIPALDQEIKSTGANNYNNIAYVDISKQYLKDAIYMLFSYPEAYLEKVSLAYFIYFLPSSETGFVSYNRKKIERLDKFYNTVFYGQLLPYGFDSLRMREGGIIMDFGRILFSTGSFLVIAFVVSLAYSLHLMIKNLSKKSEDLPFALTILFIWLNIIYVTLVGNSFEIFANQRFRFLVTPFILILTALFLNYLLTECKMSLLKKRLL